MTRVHLARRLVDHAEALRDAVEAGDAEAARLAADEHEDAVSDLCYSRSVELSIAAAYRAADHTRPYDWLTWAEGLHYARLCVRLAERHLAAVERAEMMDRRPASRAG